MPTHNFVLSNRQEALIAELVESGQFRDADEVMQEGLRLVEATRAAEASKEDELRAAVRIGIDDLIEGRFVTMTDSEQIAAHLRSLGDRAQALGSVNPSSEKP